MRREPGEKGLDQASGRYERTRMEKELVIKRLREQGCRITRQRRLILDIILETECSCCKEIYYKVQEKDKNIGPATVYRMVNVLESIGAISRKNMYKISGNTLLPEKKGCTVWLSDNTVCRLSPKAWAEVMRAGLKACGFSAGQSVTEIEIPGNREP
ncbi:MAG: transcriptional repressor [Eubacteriales bacterium]|nr:transcriptional repressor [Eubacteriales bacterium]